MDHLPAAALVLLLATLHEPSKPGKAGRPPAEAEYVKVEVKGTLRTGIVAIGAETTGITITADGVTWELDLGGSAALEKKAASLDGRTAVVKGRLRVRPGVELKQRSVVTVESLRAP